MNVPTREQIAEAIYTVRAGSNEKWHKSAFRDDYLAQADAVLALIQKGPDGDTAQAELIEYVPLEDVLLDQGITRLQLLSFLRGDDSTVWNGASNSDHSQWVRYRAHSVSRLNTLDGLTATLTYQDHDGTAAHHIDMPDADIAAALRDIDLIIDAAIAHHGPDGVA